MEGCILNLPQGVFFVYNSVMKINIKHIAKLANIPVLPEEEIKLEEELQSTLEHIERLTELATKDVVPTYQVTGLQNVWREDEIIPSFTQEEALKNAKKTHNGFFIVPGLLENK